MRLKKVLLIVFLIAAMLLSGCSRRVIDQPENDTSGDGKQILFVTDSIADEGATFAWSVLTECAQNYHAQVTLAEVQKQVDKASATLNQASEGLYDIVILDDLAGDTATDWVLRNAGYYPDVHYVCLNAQNVPEPAFDNVTCVLWDDAALYSYFGALAALGSNSKTLAFFCREGSAGAELDFLAFYAGAAAVDTGIRAQYILLGSEPLKENVEAAIGNAVSSGVDVFCFRDNAAAQDALSVMKDLQINGAVLIGAEAGVQELVPEGETLLADFSFDVKEVITNLFARCCRGDLSSEAILVNWGSSAVQFSRGRAYSSLLSAEERTMAQELYRKAKTGRLTALPDGALSPEERQELIQLANEVK